MLEKSENFNSLRPILFELCKKNYRGGGQIDTPPPAGIGLRTANSTAMDTDGSRQIALQFGPHCFEWTFLLAVVSMPIIRSDFLRHHHLLVDVAGARLLDAATLEPISAVPSTNKENI